MSDSSRRKPPLPLIVGALAAVAVLGGATYAVWPLVPTLTDPERTRVLIADAGAWAPVLFIAIQILQVMIAPIPGQVAVVVGGYLFGPFLGLVYTLIGSTIGSAIIFVLSRKLGRPFVAYFVDERRLNKFDGLTERNGPLVFFLVFLLPATPDDVIAFIAGLTKIPIGTLIVISVAGRLPGYAVLSMTGDGLSRENMNPVVVIAVVIVMLFAVAAWKRDWLRDLISSDDRVAFITDQWDGSWSTIAVWVLAAVLVAILLYRLATVVPLQR